MKSSTNDRAWICMSVVQTALLSTYSLVSDRNNYNECINGMKNINFKGKFSWKNVMNCNFWFISKQN